MLKPFYQLLIELSNRKTLAILLREFAQSRLSRLLIPSFIKLYQINVAEMEKDIKEYRTLQELFVRKLKNGLRPIDASAESVVSPVDSIIEDHGTISPEATLTVKGLTYSIDEMLGEKSRAAKYNGGYYIILYLSPSHYHRVHSPVSGNIISQWSLGKKSYPVNAFGLKYGRHPLSKNYRIITEIIVNDAHVAVVKVGAMNINTIGVVKSAGPIEKGEELGYFSFGSTVVLLFERDHFTLADDFKTPREVIVGEKLGTIQYKQAVINS